MEITEVRVKLVEKSRERLRAFCSITFDGAFVVRDLKVIGSGTGDGVFVAMPSRKLCDRCPRCRSKNHLRAKFCNDCGQKLGDQRVSKDSHGRAKIHADVAHPINSDCRETIQSAVIKAYAEELDRSKSPDYKPARFDDMEEVFVEDLNVVEPAEPRNQGSSRKESRVVEEAEVLMDEAKGGDSAFSDYDSLIAELKQEAACRQDDKREQQGSYRRQGGPAERDSTAAQPPPASNTDQGERRSGKERRDRSWGGRRQDRKEGRSDFGENVGEQETNVLAPAASSPPAAVPAQRPESKGDDSAFGAGLM